MAENIQETRPPEPPPKPPEVPSPVEQPNRSKPEDHGQPNESQESAQQDTRNAAHSAHAKATSGREPDGLRPTPEFQVRPDAHTAAPQDSAGTERPQDSSAAQRLHEATVGDGNTAAPAGEQAGEHTAAREAAAAEWAKATGDTASPGQRQPAVEDDALPHQEPLDENPPEGGYSDPVDGLRDQPQNTPPDNTETDNSAEATARLTELRDEGHGPQRHHDPTNEQLSARMGDPILDPRTGQPELKGNGHVKAQNHIDPMTGTTVDGVHGGVHRCGDYATRFDSAEDYVAADRFMRSRVSDNQPVVKAPISDVLGPDGHDRVTGYYRDPAAPGELKPVDFTGGNIVAVYNRDVNGNLTLYTMYPDPVPFHPNQPGGTAQ